MRLSHPHCWLRCQARTPACLGGRRPGILPGVLGGHRIIFAHVFCGPWSSNGPWPRLGWRVEERDLVTESGRGEAACT